MITLVKKAKRLFLQFIIKIYECSKKTMLLWSFGIQLLSKQQNSQTLI